MVNKTGYVGSQADTLDSQVIVSPQLEGELH